MREAFAGIGQRTTPAVPASRRVIRRWLMQGCQESGQGIGCLRTASRRGAVSRFTRDPGSDGSKGAGTARKAGLDAAEQVSAMGGAAL